MESALEARSVECARLRSSLSAKAGETRALSHKYRDSVRAHNERTKELDAKLKRQKVYF